MVAGVIADGRADELRNRYLVQFTALAGKRVLVVDDWRDIAELEMEVLSACGSQVTAVTSGDEATRLLAVRPFDLIVLDVVMPGVTGLDVADFVDRQMPWLADRVLFVTAGRCDPELLAAVGRRRIPCLFKPCGLNELRAAACAVVTRADERGARRAA